MHGKFTETRNFSNSIDFGAIRIIINMKLKFDGIHKMLAGNGNEHTKFICTRFNKEAGYENQIV